MPFEYKSMKNIAAVTTVERDKDLDQSLIVTPYPSLMIITYRYS